MIPAFGLQCNVTFSSQRSHSFCAPTSKQQKLNIHTLLLALVLDELQNTCKISWTEKCLKDPTYAIFLESWGFKDVKYDIPMCQSHSTCPHSAKKLFTSSFQATVLKIWFTLINGPNLSQKSQSIWSSTNRPRRISGRCKEEIPKNVNYGKRARDIQLNSESKLSDQVHPDKNPDDKERAQVAFDAVKRAW